MASDPPVGEGVWAGALTPTEGSDTVGRSTDLDPASPAEQRELHDRRRKNQPERHAKAPEPRVELARKVLAVETDDEARDEHERGDDGELLAHLVLLLR